KWWGTVPRRTPRPDSVDPQARGRAARDGPQLHAGELGRAREEVAGRLPRSPVERSSTHTTSTPCATSASHTWLPTNPAPPVTTARRARAATRAAPVVVPGVSSMSSPRDGARPTRLARTPPVTLVPTGSLLDPGRPRSHGPRRLARAPPASRCAR